MASICEEMEPRERGMQTFSQGADSVDSQPGGRPLRLKTSTHAHGLWLTPASYVWKEGEQLWLEGLVEGAGHYLSSWELLGTTSKHTHCSQSSKVSAP